MCSRVYAEPSAVWRLVSWCWLQNVFIGIIDMVAGTIRILLVEDNLTDRAAIERFFREWSKSYRVDACSLSAEAMEWLRSDLYDVALLDYRLPDGTAFDMFPLLKGTPVVLLTNVGGEEVADLALRRGAYDYLIKDREGNYLSLLPGTIQNVISRKRAEDALRESEARYQDLFDNAPDIYFLISNDGSILSVNRQISLFGYNGPDLIGHSIFNLIYPEDVSMVSEQIERALETPDNVGYLEFRMLRASGDVVHVFESHSVQPHEGNRPHVIRLICRDITDRIEAQRRERELQERVSRDERMMSLGVLAGGVAHDLNNILGPMVAYPDLLMKKFPEESREYEDLVEIKHSAERALDVVRDLLTLARRGKFESSLLEPNGIIQGYMRSPSFTDLCARYPKVTVHTNFASDLHAIAGSSNQLMKAVMNLAMNAFEAMPEGGTLTIDTANVALDKELMGYEAIPVGAYVMIRVSDTGLGIHPGILGKIFEPFYSSKKLGRSGSGLGLAVVYGVIRDHMGYIDVDSVLERGTTFSLYIPSTTQKEEVVPKDDRNVEGRERLLIVDDCPEQRAMAVRVLSSLGYEVDAAESGAAAIETIKRIGEGNGHGLTKPYDLLIMDFVMEENLNGLDTYRAILQARPGQKCIIVTGATVDDRIRAMQELGAGQCVEKPYTIEAIGRAIREELDGT